MRLKELIYSAMIACTIGMGQAFAETPAETAKKAADAAAASASEAANWAAKGHEKLQLVDTKIAALQATIADMRANGKTNDVRKTEAKLAKLLVKKEHVMAEVVRLDTASTQAALAATSAREAFSHATAEGVSEADARAAAEQAVVQAGLAETAKETAKSSFQAVLVATGPAIGATQKIQPVDNSQGDKVEDVVITDLTPTPVGLGRRGGL